MIFRKMLGCTMQSRFLRRITTKGRCAEFAYSMDTETNKMVDAAFIMLLRSLLISIPLEAKHSNGRFSCRYVGRKGSWGTDVLEYEKLS
jgi:hypothetical protein